MKPSLTINKIENAELIEQIKINEVKNGYVVEYANYNSESENDKYDCFSCSDDEDEECLAEMLGGIRDYLGGYINKFGDKEIYIKTLPGHRRDEHKQAVKEAFNMLPWDEETE